MAGEFAVIFDVDGVLVDSYQAHFDSWQHLAREEQLEMTPAQFVATFGRTSREVIAELWGTRVDTATAVRRIDDRKEALFREILEADFPAIEGAVELIDALDLAGFRLAVGSSGPPENVFLVLDKLQRCDRFGGIVTGTDVQRGKPDPQVFLLGSERIGVPPANCLVIEDAPAGVAAAHAAGMKCIGLASTGRERETLAAAERVVDSLRELDADAVRQLLVS